MSDMVDIKDIRDRICRRGPDYDSYPVGEIEPKVIIPSFSSVLHLRGEKATP